MAESSKSSGQENGEPQAQKKRENYLDWEDYFMSMALLSAQRSKDPNTQVGACIVNKRKRVVATGYNGMPDGCHDDEMPWSRGEVTDTESKTSYLCHAEMNAVLNSNSTDTTGCKMYVSLFPCNSCAQIIIQSGIKKVVYLKDDKHDKPIYMASRRLLKRAHVKIRPYRGHVSAVQVKKVKDQSTNQQPQV
ncbi:LOW QUALITY PROTEIN: deoxycytidylate deaminase-like [Physella acuta]|uniref:LOW QUALITY PROTEIN: deoxycytidylate deaminase-like n=1 Tax=Physella acuta TaxID=109671 RepID=UPI0027DD8A9B|nr:LOW QUALITY PROTEIN: deoxycytidylate deaminase-like [Physella acuta]